MTKKIAAALLGGALALSPVAASAQYNVPTYPGNVQRTSQWCDSYARDWANYATQRGQDATVGALIGGGFGAAIGGAFANRPGLGALIGGGIGAGIGAFADRPEWRAQYDWAYSHCMQQQQLAYPWLYTFNGGRYVAGSPEWYSWCTQAYGQYFNASTGYYLAANGQSYPCVVP